MPQAKIRVLVNCDDALVFWSVPEPIKGCLGFALERERTRGGQTVSEILDNRMGFSEDDPRPGDHYPSVFWPFQRLWWTDHSVQIGDEVRYRVWPIVFAEDTGLVPLESARSDWTEKATLTAGAQDGYGAYFNRGLVISQFMARCLEKIRVANNLPDRKAALKQFKGSLDQHDLPIRNFLAGALRDELLKMLAEAKVEQQHVYAALYELDDEELVAALGALGPQAHVVLANGSITKKTGETAEQARKRDQNKVGRKALRDAGCEVHDRFVSPGALGHNKFLAICKKEQGPAHTAWTGSTNWTTTGLCTQTNNGLLVKDQPAFADEYRQQWIRLRDAMGAFPSSLVDANSKPKSVKTGQSSANIWFTRTRNKEDLAALDEAIKGAKKGILFLMFQPGGTGALKTINDRDTADSKLYVRGVVSTLPQEVPEGKMVSIKLHSGQAAKPTLKLDIMQPRGIDNPFASFAATVARSEFLTMQGGVIGFAIVHSKVIVIDPFTNPIVITGSHNFSGNASTANDDNFVMIRGNRDLAERYAAHIMGVYDHYRWLSVAGRAKPGSLTGYLQEDDSWLEDKLQRSASELEFWL